MATSGGEQQTAVRGRQQQYFNYSLMFIKGSTLYGQCYFFLFYHVALFVAFIL